MHRLTWTVLPLLLCHCADPQGPEVDEPDDDETDVTIEPPPPWPHDRTGHATWTPLEGPHGTLIDDEDRPDISWTSTELSLAVGIAGYPELAPVPYGVRHAAYRYTTQDRGAEVTATGLISMPEGEPPEGGWPVVLAIHHFAGIHGPCAPSLQEFFALELAMLASQGLVLIAPDITGLDGKATPDSPHALLIADQLVWSVWDGVRAGRTFLHDRYDADALRDDLLIWGGSQGGHGTLWAELSAPYLAPEEDVKGALAIVPPIDVRQTLAFAVGQETDGLGLAGVSMLSMARWYDRYDWLDVVLEDVPPDDLLSTVIEAAEAPSTTCGGDVELSEQMLIDAILPSFAAAMADDDWTMLTPWAAVLDEQSVSAATVPRLSTTPTLIILGEDDELVEATAQEDALDVLCEDLPHLQVMMCEGADHANAAIWSIPEQVAWMRARLDGPGDPTADACGLPAPTRCSVTPD